MFGRSLHIREVDAGSCNGCEIEIVNLNSPIYDMERFGIHFVASPRHADMLLVTGPVTRNMELALQKNLRRHARSAPGRGRRRVRLQRRHLWPELRHLRRRGLPSSRWTFTFPVVRPIRTRCCKGFCLRWDELHEEC